MSAGGSSRCVRILHSLMRAWKYCCSPTGSCSDLAADSLTCSTISCCSIKKAKIGDMCHCLEPSMMPGCGVPQRACIKSFATQDQDRKSTAYMTWLLTASLALQSVAAVLQEVRLHYWKGASRCDYVLLEAQLQALRPNALNASRSSLIYTL